VDTATGCEFNRSELVLKFLLGHGMIWVDKHKGEERYCFPSTWKEERTKNELV